MYMGTKGTLIMRAETDALYYPEGDAAHATAVEVAAKTSGGAALDASESKPASQTSTGPAAPAGGGGETTERGIASRNEISRWAAAIRTGVPLLCGPEKAIHSA